MALEDFLAELDRLTADALLAFNAASDADELERCRVEFLGARSGRLKDVQKGLAGVDRADKPAAGKRFNDVKATLEAAFEAAKQRLADTGTRAAVATDFDITLPGRRPRLGHVHPITRTIEDLKEIMGRSGLQRGRRARGGR